MSPDQTAKAIDLNPFCAIEADVGRSRIALTAPFSRGEWTYATDGKVAVRVPRRPAVPENAEAPAIERVWPQVAATDFVPVVPIKLPKRDYVRCDVCDGRGTDHNCPSCQCTCSECDGKGALEELVALKAGPARVPRRAAEVLMAIPGAEVSPVAVGPMQFRFPGGEGIMTVLGERSRLPIVASLIGEEIDGE